MEIDKNRMVQFLPLGLQLPEDHPDRNRYLSLDFRRRPVKSSDVADDESGRHVLFFIQTEFMTAAIKRCASNLKK